MTYAHRSDDDPSSQTTYIHMYIYICVCIYIYMYICVYISLDCLVNWLRFKPDPPWDNECVAGGCSGLQWVAMGCGGLRWVAVGCSGLHPCNKLQKHKCNMIK